VNSPEQHRRLGDARNAIGRLLAAYADVRPSSTGLPRREDVGFEQLKPLLVPDGTLVGLEPIDIGTVVATIDGAGELALDKLAYDTRSSVGRPRTAG